VTATNVKLVPSLVSLAFAFGGCGESPAGEATASASAGTGGSVASNSAGTAAGGNSAGTVTGGVSMGGGSGSSSGGSANTAGSGVAATAGSSGAPGGGTGGATAGLCNAGNCSDFVGGFDGYLFEYPCAAGDGCSGEMCVMGALTLTKDFQVKGDPNKVYRVDFRVRGITESKNYEGGTRRSTMSIDPGPAGGDLWYEGGTAPVSTYSSYELHVKPAVAGAPNDYYLNARDGTGEHDGTTWALNYLASVKVNGGGTITFKTFDSNCSAIMNCGPKGANGCTPRTFDLSDAVPTATATQPIANQNMKSVQWLHIDVLNVEAL
jgi:hypothetical protein